MSSLIPNLINQYHFLIFPLGCPFCCQFEDTSQACEYKYNEHPNHYLWMQIPMLDFHFQQHRVFLYHFVLRSGIRPPDFSCLPPIALFKKSCTLHRILCHHGEKEPLKICPPGSQSPGSLYTGLVHRLTDTFDTPVRRG